MKRLLIIPGLIFLLACDLDRFISSDVQSQELIKSANVSGTIIGYYTSDSVGSAHIRIGSQKTMSKLNGTYSLTYLLSETDERNKPIEVEVSKQDYYSQIFEIVLAPTENEFSFSLKYAAPIIVRTVRVPEDVGEMGMQHTFQAIVKDYQGSQTISRVWAKQLFTDDMGNLDSVYVDLQRVQTLNATTAYFQNQIDRIGGLERIERFYTVWAEDDEGFRDEETRGYRPINPDTLIF